MDPIKKHQIEAETTWGKAYELFDNIVSSNKLRVGAEIGVAFGGHAYSLLSNTDIVKLYGIDPYRYRLNYEDPFNLSQPKLDRICEFANNRLSIFGDRYEHIRETSSLAVERIDQKLDFVYIDADHSYDGVYNDLVVLYEYIRDGGIIGGHDYGHVNFPGVQRAIDTFFNRFGWVIHSEGEGVWWVQKQPLNISFFMPAYNCETTIKESMESILNNNAGEDDEIIVVDDGSTDSTIKVITELDRDLDIKLLKHKRNKGGAAARNTAIENARYSLLFCLDSDNILPDNSIPKLKKQLIESEADISTVSELWYFKKDIQNITHKWKFKDGYTGLADHLAGTVVPGASGNYLFTLRSWEGSDGYPEFAGALDTWGFAFLQLASGFSMISTPETHYFHRIGIESYWVRQSRSVNISLKALQVILPYLELIHSRDLKYILSEKGRRVWFEQIDRRPIRLRDGSKGTAGKVIN